MDVLKTLEKLPPLCAARQPSDNSPVIIRRGISGYYPAPLNLDVDGFNARHGVSEVQREAMVVGSMFGCDVPGADPDKYR